MKKMQLEIITSVGSAALLIILMVGSKLYLMPPGFGHAGALLLYVFIMSFAGLKLAEMPDK